MIPSVKVTIAVFSMGCAIRTREGLRTSLGGRHLNFKKMIYFVSIGGIRDGICKRNNCESFYLNNESVFD